MQGEQDVRQLAAVPLRARTSLGRRRALVNAEIITIGDELMRGEIVDSNKARIKALLGNLARLGDEVPPHRINLRLSHYPWRFRFMRYALKR